VFLYISKLQLTGKLHALKLDVKMYEHYGTPPKDGRRSTTASVR